MSKTLKSCLTVASTAALLTGVLQLINGDTTGGLYFATAILLILPTMNTKEEN